MADPGIVRRGELIGHYMFPEMDRVVHLGKGFGFGLSMCSTRIANFESINGEQPARLVHWRRHDHALQCGSRTHLRDAYWATVDAYRLPGVTADVTHSKLPH